jgi:outer membrane protease
MRWLLLGLSLSGLAASLTAQSFDEYPRVDVSLSPVMAWGQAQELVYLDSSSDNYLSRLDWSIPPSLGINLQTAIHWAPYLETAVTASVFWPLAKTDVTDDDWLTDGGSTNQNGTPTISPTVHSDSTADLTAWYQVRAEFGVPITMLPLAVETFQLKPVLGADFRCLSWTAWDATQTSQGSSESFFGEVLAYQQNWLMPFLGADFSVAVDDFSFEIGLRGSPYIFVSDTDNHLVAVISENNVPYDRTFIDTMQGGWMLNPHITIGGKLSEHCKLDASFDFMIVQGPRGDTSTVYNGLSDQSSAYQGVSQSVAGAGLNVYSASLTLTILP